MVSQYSPDLARYAHRLVDCGVHGMIQTFLTWIMKSLVNVCIEVL